MAISRNELNIIISARDEKMRKVFERAERRAAKFERDTRRHTGRTTRHFDRMARGSKRASDQISAAFPSAGLFTGATAGAVALGAALTGVVRNGDKLVRLRGRLKAITGSVEQAASGVEGLSDIMLETGTDIDTASNSFVRFTQAGKNIGATQKEVLTLTDTLLKLGRIGGGSAQELTAGAVQLGQALASGQLRGDELRSVMENLPLVTEALADSLGVSVGKLREMAENGELTARKVFDALLSKAEETNRKFAELPLTVDMAAGKMSAAWSRFAAQIDDSIGLSRTLARVLDGIAGRFERASLTGLDLVQAQISEQQALLAQRGPGSLPSTEQDRVREKIAALKAVEAQYLTSEAAKARAVKKTKLAEDPTEGPGKPPRGGGSSVAPQAPITERLDGIYGESIDFLIQREELIGKTAAAQARLNAENALRNRLESEAGDEIHSGTVRNDIEELVTAYGKLAEATHNAEEAERARQAAADDAQRQSEQAARDAEQWVNSTVDGLVSAGMAAGNFADGLKNIGKQLAILAASDTLKGLFGLGGTSGSVFGSLGSLLGSSSLGSIRLGFKDGVVGVGKNGRVMGPGGPRGDKVPAMLSEGETVMTARATQRNAPMLRAMNEGKSFSGGGHFSASTAIHVNGNVDDSAIQQMQRMIEVENSKFYRRWVQAQKSFNERAA